jgi:hypothetical protein
MSFSLKRDDGVSHNAILARRKMPGHDEGTQPLRQPRSGPLPMTRLDIESALDVGNQLPNPDVTEVLVQGKRKQIVLMSRGSKRRTKKAFQLQLGEHGSQFEAPQPQLFNGERAVETV